MKNLETLTRNELMREAETALLIKDIVVAQNSNKKIRTMQKLCDEVGANYRTVKKIFEKQGKTFPEKIDAQDCLEVLNFIMQKCEEIEETKTIRDLNFEIQKTFTISEIKEADIN